MTDQLPRLTGRRLDGLGLDLPRDLDGPTLLLVAYRQDQQRQVDTWLALASELAVTGVATLEVPLLARRWIVGRRLIDGGMAANMDVATRRSTMTVYGDPGGFRSALDLPADEIAALLVDADGTIRWRGLGVCDAAAASALRAAVAER